MPDGPQYSFDTKVKTELREKQPEGAVKTFAERGSEIGGDVQAVAKNIKSAIGTSVKDHPMASLAVAAALGFALGALWKS